MATAPAEDEDEPFEALPEEFVFMQPLAEQERRTTYREVRDANLSVKLTKQKRTPYRTAMFKKTLNFIQPLAPVTLTEILGINRLAISFDGRSARTVIHFGRDFESANLQSVKQLAPNCYRLTLNPDRNSNKHCQWFYFSCQGLDQPTKFIISGFTKPTSLFNEGMKICVFEQQQWKRGGEQIIYAADPINGYSLSFQYPFGPGSGRKCFAYCFPYTFTELRETLTRWEERRSPHLNINVCGRSLLNYNIYCLTITNQETSPNRKQSIILTARTHPGQTQSSYILQELVERLLSNSFEAQLLRRKYIFKIFPMVNPDGVLLGNYRLSYSGNDLNRKWRQTSARLHPEIHSIKQHIRQLHPNNPVRLMIDLHGHSRKKGVFFYGNASRKHPHSCQQLPYLMSELSPSFCYKNCSFVRHRSKQGTQRIAMSDLLKSPFIYTMESSFCGDGNSTENYSIEDYKSIGGKLFEGMFLYLTKELSTDGRLRSVIRPQHVLNLDQGLTAREESMKKLYRNDEQLQVGLSPDDDDGSESAPSEGCLEDDELFKLLRFLPATELEEGKPTQSLKFRIKLKEMKMSQNLSKLKQTSVSPSGEDPPKRISSNEQPTYQIGRCKLRVINGSIFDRNNEQLPNYPRMRNQTEDTVKLARQRALNPIRSEEHTRLLRHQRTSSDHHGGHPVRTEGSEVGVPPSFYPSRKQPQPVRFDRNKRSVTEDLADLCIGPNRQARKLSIRQSTNF